MEKESETISILKVTEESSSKISDVVARESPLTIVLNNQELVTLLCSPRDLNYLAVGFLASEGLLDKKDDLSTTD